MISDKTTLTTEALPSSRVSVSLHLSSAEGLPETDESCPDLFLYYVAEDKWFGYVCGRLRLWAAGRAWKNMITKGVMSVVLGSEPSLLTVVSNPRNKK